jgi:hypothetical protein
MSADKPPPSAPYERVVRVLAIMGGGWLSTLAIPAANGNLIAGTVLGCGIGWLVGELVIIAVETVRAWGRVPRQPAAPDHN